MLGLQEKSLYAKRTNKTSGTETFCGRNRDRDQVAKVAIGKFEDEAIARKEYAQKGGLKGGTIRAQQLTPRQRREIAQRPARIRWRQDRCPATECSLILSDYTFHTTIEDFSQYCRRLLKRE